MREWSDTNLKCGIGKEEEHLTRDEGGGAPEKPSLARLLLAIYSEEGEEARVFGELEEEEGEKALADGETTMPMG